VFGVMGGWRGSGRGLRIWIGGNQMERGFGRLFRKTGHGFEDRSVCSEQDLFSDPIPRCRCWLVVLDEELGRGVENQGLHVKRVSLPFQKTNLGISTRPVEMGHCKFHAVG